MTRTAELPALHDRVQRAVRAWRAGMRVTAVDQLPGGASSLTFRADLTDSAGEQSTIVVKVAPEGLAPTGNRDVLRQARLLAALRDTTDVVVPDVLFTDESDGAPPMFAMTFAPGQSFEPIMDELVDPPAPADIDKRARSAARMLAALHRHEPASLGISEQPAELTAELGRWARSFGTVEPGLSEGADAVRTRLERSVPASVRPAIVHGDYRLGNMLAVGGTITAVIDWEIWSVTDPRIDLAWFLMFTDPADQPTALRSMPGMPDKQALLADYERAAGAPVAELAWFHGFVRYKQAAAIALIVKRRRQRAIDRDEDPGPLSQTPRLLLEQAQERLG